ncbi:MAG: hypothetical protein LUF34_03905 [Lachnospiraceae bacterium]|nr:hypothetical protein [Lachnospiraceae bacterium]
MDEERSRSVLETYERVVWKVIPFICIGIIACIDVIGGVELGLLSMGCVVLLIFSVVQAIAAIWSREPGKIRSAICLVAAFALCSFVYYAAETAHTEEISMQGSIEAEQWIYDYRKDQYIISLHTGDVYYLKEKEVAVMVEEGEKACLEVAQTEGQLFGSAALYDILCGDGWGSHLTYQLLPVEE